MAIGDRITGERTTGFMRRINALENNPRPSITVRNVAGQMAMDIDTSNGDIWIGGGGVSVDTALKVEKSPLRVSDLIDTYPLTETSFPDHVNIFNGDIYTNFVSGSLKKYKYDISGDSWSELSSADSNFLAQFTLVKNDGTTLHAISGSDSIDTFNTSGVSQSTITLGKPSNIDTGDGDTWLILDYDFDDDGNILGVYEKLDGFSGDRDSHITRWNTSGTLLFATFTGPANQIEFESIGPYTTDDPNTISCNQSNGYFVAGVLGINHAAIPCISYQKDGTVEASDLVGTDDNQILYGLRYYNSEIYTLSFLDPVDDNVESILSIFNSGGTLQASLQLFEHTQVNTQTTFHRYPTPNSDTAKVSLGTPDGGTSVPSLTGLDGFRPHYFELRDMRSACEAEAVDRRIDIDSGTTTSTTADKLVDSGQNFSTTVSVGDKVKNMTDGSKAIATVDTVDSDTTLSLSVDIMLTDENYLIYTPYTTTAGDDNIFRLAIDSGQDDWTSATVTHKDRIREDYYSDIDEVLTELESAPLVFL